jgi:hypothetical protein
MHVFFFFFFFLGENKLLKGKERIFDAISIRLGGLCRLPFQHSWGEYLPGSTRLGRLFATVWNKQSAVSQHIPKIRNDTLLCEKLKPERGVVHIPGPRDLRKRCGPWCRALRL